jgi:hypothetical protein
MRQRLRARFVLVAMDLDPSAPKPCPTTCAI